MTDGVLIPTPVRLSSTKIEDKTEAFRRAARHSARVRWMRAGLLVGAILLALGVTSYALLDPFRAVLPAGASIDSAGLSGSRVTMGHPTMSGFRKDGQPYDFKAETAVQDLKAPSLLQLNKLDAHVTMSDGVAHIEADVGMYDTSKELMDLTGNIHITSSNGADIRMRSAHIEFNGGNVSSKEPVSVRMTTGNVTADAMHMTGNGADITFDGHVHSVMNPPTSSPPKNTGTIGLRP